MPGAHTTHTTPSLPLISPPLLPATMHALPLSSDWPSLAVQTRATLSPLHRPSAQPERPQHAPLSLLSYTSSGRARPSPSSLHSLPYPPLSPTLSPSSQKTTPGSTALAVHRAPQEDTKKVPDPSGSRRVPRPLSLSFPSLLVSLHSLALDLTYACFCLT